MQMNFFEITMECRINTGLFSFSGANEREKSVNTGCNEIIILIQKQGKCICANIARTLNRKSNGNFEGLGGRAVIVRSLFPPSLY